MLLEQCYGTVTVVGLVHCLQGLREEEPMFPTDWDEKVGKAWEGLKKLLPSMVHADPAQRPTAASVAASIRSMLDEQYASASASASGSVLSCSVYSY